MTDRTVRSAALAKQAPTVTRQDAIAQIVRKHEGNLAALLPSGMSGERFARLLLVASSNAPALMKCDPVSFLAAGVTCAQLGLEPNDPRGLAYLVPFGNKVQVIIGYQGYMDLARRSGQVGAIHAVPIYEGDHFEYEMGLEPRLIHRHNPEGDEDPAKLTHVYAIAELLARDGTPTGKQFVVLTRRQVDKARTQSKSSDRRDSPWQTHYPEMAQKTAIRRLAKFLPQSVEIATAFAREDRDLTLGDLSAMSGAADDEDVIEANHTGPDDDPGPVWEDEPDPAA